MQTVAYRGATEENEVDLFHPDMVRALTHTAEGESQQGPGGSPHVFTAISPSQ